MMELIVDSFAGGGGASTGIELALGRSPDIAVNHDAIALAMHEVNHPATKHLTSDIWSVDPVAVCDGRPVGLLWASPDCKHFSKAKGGKPVEKKIRGLAWVVVHWANTVSPRVIILENVEEFQTWGPLGADNKPCPLQKGMTFKRWIGELQNLGYAVEWRELRACDYGAPTIRKRLFLIARRDCEPIVWPTASHKLLKAYRDGRADIEKVEPPMKPARVAAGIIDWSLPCPSIFDSAAEIMAKYGLRAVRPLQGATTTRIAKGVRRYVLDAVRPFLVSLTHHGGERTESVDEPMATVTGAHRGEKAVVTPFVAGVGGRMAQTEPRGVDQPVQTLTSKADSVLVAPSLVRNFHGEKQDRAVTEPVGTLMTGNHQMLVAPHLTKFRANSIGSGIDEPVPTVTANSFIKRAGGAAPLGVVAPHLMTMRNAEKPFQGIDQPTHTVTAGGAGQGVVAAFMAQNNYLEPGHDVREPVSTVVGKGSTQGLVAANLLRQFGAGIGSSLDEPARTVMADGQGKTQLSAAFISKYYGTGDGSLPDEPLHTVTTKDRFGFVHALVDIPPFLPEHEARARQVADLLRSCGLWDDREFVTVEIDGVVCVITDIGMRMLTPRELFRAQGFPDSYIIDRKPDGSPISKTEQVSKCGNSVCPPVAAALVRANYAPREVEPPLFMEAAE